MNKLSWYEKNKEKHKANRKAYYQLNKEQQKLTSKAWQESNPDLQKAYVKKYNKKHPEKTLASNQIYRENNKEKERERRKSNYYKNKAYSRAGVAKRKAAKLNQTPKWADLKGIQKFYENCPEGHEVDHIIPLQGKNVRGLHVLENLQYLPIFENRKKSNKFKL
jgi:hypothetical protein